MLTGIEKSEVDGMWASVFGILLHHNIYCEYFDLDKQHTCIKYQTSDKRKTREINLYFLENKLRVKIWRLTDMEIRESTDLIKNIPVNSSSKVAIVAAHELQGKECRYCTVRLDD